ncbi:ABC transporter substrate-binding protein [Ideonella sp. 4Y11]|uniref:ABC transporter substrate-binding protein n=1 Tax=Ideonella aquatica TaxID=2824119 RepID=A0A941BG56_9BURK|nr:ABC transporter substrate-binding protein [Ideonella aquatica]MBQ0959471.1 ABC transporter substrate-binding protein [Ideonella aquatica]
MVGVFTALRRVRALWAPAMGLAALLGLAGCDNSPWVHGEASRNVIHSAMIENTPRHLDPTASYWSNDTLVTYQVYEPPYGYHYLKRPFELVPKSAEQVVKPRYYDKSGKELDEEAPGEQVAESVYDVPIRKGILFQPHPAFAKDERGNYRYHAMKPGDIGERRSVMDFEHTGTRELVAEDFVYALKRHATTRITTPIFGIFSEYVIGLKEYGDLVKAEDKKLRAGTDPASLDKPFLDFRRWPLAGATAPEKHLLRIRLHGKYPQWKYWMQMTFTAPIPWEADAFYAQPGMAARGLTLDMWPVGTGPFMVTEYVKDRRITMQRNPNYRGVPYPCEGSDEDKAKGLLADCGKPTPFIDTIIATVEREATPQKNKFRDGYYDLEVFERTDTGKAYLVEMDDSDEVRADYTAKGFDFGQYSDVNSYIIGFNMIDPVIGYGDTPQLRERNRKLRQAISIAIDWEEYSKIFPKKAGVTAMSPLPQGIPGSREGQPEGVNPVTHKLVDGQYQRRTIEDAKKLMVEAGYPDGREASSGKPLVINYDYYAPATPERKPEIDWVVKQFAKLGIQLEVRATDNNQFQDKVRKGKHQVFWLGWNADYPDAENFLFLLYGPNSKSVSDGENTSNYQNAEYDKLFAQLKTMDDGPAKQALIDRMVRILQEDAPWSFGFYPYASAAVHGWIKNSKPAILIRDHGRYLRLDAAQRAEAVARWNRPVWWPLLLLLLVAAGGVVVARRALRKRERMNARGEVLA